MRDPLIVDGRNLLDPDGGPRRRLRLRGHRPRRLAARDVLPETPSASASRSSSASGGDHPRRRQGRAARRRRRRPAEAARRGRAAGRSPRTRSAGSPRAGVDARDRRVRGRAGGAVRARARRASAPEIVAVGEPEPLGRGGGIRFAAQARRESGDVFALNGDELVDVDFARAARRGTASAGAAATIAVAPLALAVRRRRARRRRRGRPASARRRASPYWVNCGIYVLGEEALERLPERGDHETTTFPELAAERRLRAFRHEGSG